MPKTVEKIDKYDLFCLYVAAGYDFLTSAAKSGYKSANAGAELILKPETAEKIKKCSALLSAAYNTSDMGYRKLAFSSYADAVKLIAAFQSCEQSDISRLPLGELDLACISELKLNKGTLEIKFFDRFAALKGLAESENTKNRNPARFFEAIASTANAAGPKTDTHG